MAYDKTQSIEEFLNAAAAKQPTPGGGAVAALTGALAASMGEMVLNYSVNKKDLAEHQPDLQRALTELNRARQALLELMVEDQAGYETLTAIRKLPATDPQREAKFNVAVAVCIQVPQAIGATAVAILHVCERVVDISNKFLLSDLAVCAELAMATVRCAAYNVRVNLGDLPDANERARLEATCARQIVDCGGVVRNIIARIWARQGHA
ncbi:MAG TPA: cyclodeaminase/cyclohydrolase family protein [Tepidisphaeraceae bacterium]|nr:cyclodeaminase/cyclohydrolase family protein [Tepidisphaeraceae bacterium]